MLRRRQGFTLVELTISAALLASILLLLSTTINESATATRRDLAHNEAMAAARKIVQQLSRELSASGGHQGGADHVTPDRAAGTGGTPVDTITFAMRTGLSGVEANDWGAAITYRLTNNGDTPGNGIDEDRDNVWDERRLERVQGGAVVPLDESVTAFAIERAAGSDMITITLEVSRAALSHGVATSAKDWVRVRLVTNVYVRNRV